MIASAWRLGGVVVAAVLVCTAPAAWSNTVKVAFINPNRPPEFWQRVCTTMRAAADQLGIDLEIRDSSSSRDRYIAIARHFLAQRPPPDFLIATNDLSAGGKVVELANAAHVKTILLNNDLNESHAEPRTKYPYWLGSIVPDHEGAGYGIATEILTAAQELPHRPLKILALTGDATTPASVERVRGLERGIKVMSGLLGPNSVQLVGVRYLDWTEKTAEASVREFVKSGPHIDALWAANDPMALGAITALKAAGYHPGVDVMVGGLNWSQPAVERVLSHEMVVTYGGHFLLGAWAMVVIRDYVDGRDFAEEDVRLEFPMGAFDLPVAQRFPKIGTVDWNKVDFSRFSKTRNPSLARYNFSPDAVLSQLKAAH
jgi:ABC-type sugar transport system substrate-binding protein